MNEMRVTLVPMQYSSHAIEKVLMLDDQLDPISLFHIDFLWDSLSHEIHEKLSDGMTVECKLIIMELT